LTASGFADVDEGRQQVEVLSEAVPHHEQVLQLDRPVRLDHDAGRAATSEIHAANWSAFATVRQAHERHVQRRAEDDSSQTLLDTGPGEVNSSSTT